MSRAARPLSPLRQALLVAAALSASAVAAGALLLAAFPLPAPIPAQMTAPIPGVLP